MGDRDRHGKTRTMTRATPAASPAVDPEVLESLRELGVDSGDPAVFEGIVEAFLSGARESCAALQAAFAAGDAGTMAQVAHRLRGGAATMGANPLADIARRLEDLAGAGRLGELGPDVGALESELRRVVAALAPSVSTGRD